jgi:hypothetical protein
LIRDCAPGTSCRTPERGGFLCDFVKNNPCTNSSSSSSSSSSTSDSGVAGAAGSAKIASDSGSPEGDSTMSSVIYGEPRYNDLVYYTIFNVTQSTFKAMVTISSKNGFVNNFRLSFDLPTGQTVTSIIPNTLKYTQEFQTVTVNRQGNTNITDFSFTFFGTYIAAVLGPSNFRLITDSPTGAKVSSLLGPIVAYSYDRS